MTKPDGRETTGSFPANTFDIQHRVVNHLLFLCLDSMGGRTVQVSGFPAGISGEKVKDFLESLTGHGTVYVCKVRNPKDVQKKSRVFAVVQFTTPKSAELISCLAQPRSLYYEKSWLNVRYLDRDVIPQPRTPLFVLDQVVLHFGCLVSKETYYSLHLMPNVNVQFGFGMRKIYFFLTCGRVEYKLDLYYENVWQIQLRHQKGMKKKYLLFQLQGAPRIFQKPPCSLSVVYGDTFLDYFKDLPDDQWVRTTDFTPLCSIGQSSTLCLELLSGSSLPNIGENFAHYKCVEDKFTIQHGFSYSHGLQLVPIVKPPPSITLPFKILFKINSLVHFGYLVGPTLTEEFYNLLSPSVTPLHHTELALEKLSRLTDCCFEPEKWLKEQLKKFDAARHVSKSAAISSESGLVHIHRIQVTPSRVYFYGPEVNVSNRVTRQYPNEMDNFLRVSFIDEDSEKIRSTDLSQRATVVDGQNSTLSHKAVTPDDQNMTPIYKRVLSTLTDGIGIGDKRFEFLAYSSSQLRENSLWMFASHPELRADDIRQWMGDFSSIRNVAKYAARLGQSFSSSTETLNVDAHETENIPDVVNDKYNFSDGIGKISPSFAKEVAKKCGCKITPSAFQIRYGGYKGVVAIDPTSNCELSLRKSMSKYKSDNTQVDVLSWSKYQPCFLNRQIINLLSTLGVKDNVFEMKQNEVVVQLDKILTDAEIALKALELMPSNENTYVLSEMLHCGYLQDSEPFLSMMLQTLQATKLFDLRKKTKIFIPEGRTMMGCMDETRTLEYGQIFVQYSGVGKAERRHSSIVKGSVVVAKNPCLHPGDVRVLQAIDVPALHHLVDCAVFPQKGKRPHPNECSGSDLDGDLYFVSWDPALIPPRQIDPMDYDPAPPKVLDYDVSIQDIQEYFANYMINDSMGMISNAHTVFADKEPEKAESKPCIELAKLFSAAVDFPKTGIPALLPPHLRVREYPDFMEKPDKPTYQSKGIIGKLFREIKDKPQEVPVSSFTKRVARQAYDHDLEVDGYQAYLDDAEYFKSKYDHKVASLMHHYKFKTEAELLWGRVVSLSGSYKKSRDAEGALLAVKTLRKEARDWFSKKSSKPGKRGDGHEDQSFAKASAWYHVTYHPDYWGAYSEDNQPHFISFPWCVYDRLIAIKKDKIKAANARGRSEKGKDAQLRHILNSLRFK